MQAKRTSATIRSGWVIAGAVLLAALAVHPLPCSARTINLIINPDFGRVYAAQPLENANLPYRRSEHQWIPRFEDGIPPFLPYGWSISGTGEGIPMIAQALEDGRTALRVRTGSGERLLLRQQFLEIIPGAPYALGFDLRGRGRVRLQAVAQTPAPHEVLAEKTVDAGDGWEPAEMTLQSGPHRRLLRLVLEVGPDAEVQIRGVRLEATVVQDGPSPDELQTQQAVKDDHTLFFEDFDGSDPVVQPGAEGRVTADGEGRDGRGLIVSPTEGGSITRIPFGMLPGTGTISFWFKPSRLPEKAQETLFPLAINTRTPGRSETRVQFGVSHWLGSVSFGFRKERYAQDAAVSEHGSVGWGRWRPETWHHFAGSWDGEVTRLYVDGVLEGILTGDDKVFPQGEAMDLVLDAAGTIDSIKIVEGLPFGPFVPAGSEPGSYRPPTPAAAPVPAPPVAAVPTTEDRVALRAKNLHAVPDSQADYVFGSGKLQPAWADMEGLRERKDYYGPGADAMEVSFQNRVGYAAFWSMEGIAPSDYHVGIWVQTDGGANGEYSPAHLNITAFRNGWPLRLGTTRDPVQIKPNVWLTEVQTVEPVRLHPGDEIALVPHRMAGAQNVFQLALYRQEPPRGHGVTGRTFGAPDGVPLRLRLVLQPHITGEAADGEPLAAVVNVANPLPHEIRAEVEWSLSDHFGKAIAGRTESVVLAPHAVQVIRHEFMAVGRDESYHLSVRSRPTDGFRFPEERPIDLMDLYEGVQAELTPDLPDPLTVWNHARMNLTKVTSGFRRRVSLDGRDWQRANLAGRHAPESVPEGLEWRTVAVPVIETWVAAPPDVFGFWYRRTFEIPEGLAGERLLLEFESGSYGVTEATAYVNGHRIGSGFTQLSPLRLDVPGQALRQGEPNELVVCTRGAIALMNPDFVEQYAPGDIHLAMEHQQYPGHIRHAAHLGSVRLITRPAFAVRQVLPLSDPESGRVMVLVRVENATSEPRHANLRLAFQQAGLDVPHDAAPLAVEVGAGEMQEYRIEARVTGLTAYAPSSPALAHAALTLENQGQILDRLDCRFGYRSVRIQGTEMMLNGKPFRFFGYGPNFNTAHIHEMENDLRGTRCLPRYVHTDYDLIGEIGVVNYRDVGFAWAQRWKKLNNAEFWESMRSAAVEQVWEFGAHPAIIGWNISNESYHYAPYSTGTEGQVRHGELIASLAQAIRDATGSDFWFLADGDEDLGGRLDYCSFHYVNHWGVFHGFNNRAETFGHYDGISHYPPDHFFLDRASGAPKPGTVLGMRPDWTYGEVAFADTESYWFDSNRNGIGIAKYVGDAAATSSALQFFDPRGMAWTKTSMEGYRDMGATGIKGIYWQSFFNLPAQSVSFTMPEMQLRYYSGARFDRRISLFDDEYRPGRLEFLWTLADPSGATVRSGRVDAESTTSFLHRDRIAFDLPEVSERIAFKLTLELRKDGRRKAYEERRIEVWAPLPPAQIATPGAPRLAVFDPGGTTAPVLARLGVRFANLPSLEAGHLAAHRVLLVGPGVASGGMNAERELLKTFAAGGGRVLLLEQEHSSLLPLDVVLERKLHASQNYVRMAAHPVMEGLSDRDLQFWNPDHVAVRGAYHKPSTGAFRPLADTSQNGTMAWSVLIECPVGSGVVLASQFSLIDAFETEPMAAELLRRLLVYLGGSIEPAPPHRLAVLTGASEDVLKRLSDVRAVFELREAPSGEDPVLLLDLDAAAEPPDAVPLRAYLEAGGTLVVHRARPEHAEWLAVLSGRSATISIQPYAAWADRQMLKRRDGLLAGLNNLDFYWRPPVPGEGWNSTMQVSRPPASEHGQVDWIARIEGGVEHLFPGGITEVPVGAGRLVVNQIRWTLRDVQVGPGSPERILSMMLTHLGIARRMPAPRPQLPPGTRYEPVDLSTIANRGFRDEAAGDGEGWIDWGPTADLSSFPTGRAAFNGVPFLIPEGERNALVLRMAPRYSRGLEDLADAFAIPVDRDQVAGLVFLHTGGWMFGIEPYGRREVEYADGTVETMLLNGTNTGDWNPGWENFPDEVGTVTRVAWTGANAQYPVIRVYQTLWVNPHPEKKIVSVRITNADLPEKHWRFLVHMGLTVALLPDVGAEGDGPEDVPQAAERDAARSLNLLNEALALAADRKQAAAVERLEDALRADDRNIGAWIALTEFHVERADPDAFRMLIERWITVLPESYQAYNIYGKYLEDRGLKSQSLAAFRRSLEIEWNQPFTIQAVERLSR